MNNKAQKLHRMGHLMAQLAWAVFAATFALIFAVWQFELSEVVGDACMASLAALGGASAGALAIFSALLHERANESEPIEELIFPVEMSDYAGERTTDPRWKDAA